MRSTRMRVVVAGVLGVAAIALASPASAETPSPVPTETAAVSSPTSTAPAAAGASSSASPTPTAAALAATSPSATPSVDPSATPSPVAGATASVDPSASASASATPAAAAASTGGTGDPTLDGFLDLLPFKVPLDKEINGIEDIDVNPLVLTFTCNGSEPAWKLKNTSGKSFGFGWFDTNLGGGILDIGPKQTVDIPSKALAVVGSPWDAETKLLLVTVPTVGVSNCGGATSAPPAIAAPVALPVAAPAASSSVTAEPYYTG
ncbi:hypothetical protein ND748_13920 [Frankia sp. AiPs1]|uniref:hypothetical protein n=1 Tax=Frankia sp. AiPs1 TaxID=573493 RepID=UPI002042FF9C|nr:hypothetical protein [Frankia sp. AiPs1]MCM3922753.1 hypothetical protein [Frankia sp. AiPs1]